MGLTGVLLCPTPHTRERFIQNFKGNPTEFDIHYVSASAIKFTFKEIPKIIITVHLRNNEIQAVHNLRGMNLSFILYEDSLYKDYHVMDLLHSRLRVQEDRDAIGEVVLCSHCPNQGYYLDYDYYTGEPTQVECEVCHTTPNSLYNTIDNIKDYIKGYSNGAYNFRSDEFMDYFIPRDLD